MGGVPFDLQEVSSNVNVYFTSVRRVPVANEWNMEFSISNRTAIPIGGPVIMLVESFSGTSGPLRADGLSGGKVYYDVTAQLAAGVLQPGEKSPSRTIALGYTAGATPRLVTRIFAAGLSTNAFATGFTRTLNEAGQPLPGVSIEETGPAGKRTIVTQGPFSGATLGEKAGHYVWKFERPGYLPVWRESDLSESVVTLIAAPRLTPRGSVIVTNSPAAGGSIEIPGVQVQFAPGSFNEEARMILTPVETQSLPAFLPQGWSPLQAFWVELDHEPSGPGTARLIPWGPVKANEGAALVRFDSQSFSWFVLQPVVGAETNALAVSIPGNGAYALVVPDTGKFLPPPANVGNALQPCVTAPLDLEKLVAGGFVAPAARPAATDPAQVTAQATVIVTNLSGPLPSGTVLRGEITERYLLQNGSQRVPPAFDNFIVACQRPGDDLPETLQARFPLRPRLLFSSADLNEGLVHVDLYAPGAFTGAVVGTNGGVIAAGAIRLFAGTGVLTGRQAVELRVLSATNFASLAGTNYSVAAAFEESASDLVSGTRLNLQIDGLVPNARFVLARVVDGAGDYGLEPRERFHADGTGVLVSDEPASGDRLAGLTNPGQYVLVQISLPQGLVTGIVRSSTGQPAGGLPVRTEGQPWLTISASDGSFKLLAPAGTAVLDLRDPGTEGRVTQSLNIPADLSSTSTSMTALSAGLRVASITPSDKATAVPTVGSVVVQFNKPINPASFASTPPRLTTASGTNVPVTATLNLANTTVTLLPNTTLEAAAEYRIILSTNTSDAAGDFLVGQNEFTFTTKPLSVRDPAAQLIIYEPGATNVPVEIVTSIPGFTPGTNRTAIVVHGTAGAADPGVPVIVANESSGETTTVLSKSDGSFNTFVNGSESDFVSATLVSQNGARVYIPVSRQLFDNGFVGLYRQGGILEAQSDGGPVQVFIQPNSIPERTKFRMEPLSLAQLKTQLGGVTPEGGKPAGGALRLNLEGQPPTLPMHVNFPVDLAALGFPADEPASNAPIALTVVRDTQGVKTFEVLDQMVFSRQPPPSPLARQSIRPASSGSALAGFIFTVSGFVPGAVGLIPLVYDWIIVPTLMLGTKPVVVTGHTFYYQVQDPHMTNQALIGKQQLSGTYVVLQQLNGPEIGQPGRLQPGWVYATTGPDGVYKMIAPFAGIDYRLSATHPQFQDIREQIVSDLIHKGGSVQDFIFKNPLTNQLKPHVSIANAPVYPAANQASEVQVNAYQALGGAPVVEAEILEVVKTNLFTGQPEPDAEATLTNVTSTPSGNSTLWRGELTATKPVSVVLNIRVQGFRQSLDPIHFPIAFAGVPPAPTNNVIPAPDTNDVHGPLVVSTVPPESGFVDHSGKVTVIFNKPVDTYVKDHLQGVVLEGAGASAITPIVRLNDEQNVLTLQFPGLEPGADYTLMLSSQSVRDLAGQPLDQRPSTPVADSFRMTFRGSPVVVTNLPELQNGRGSVISGKYLYALDQGPKENDLVAYDISVPSRPVYLSRTRLTGMPRDIILIPQYNYVTTAHSPAKTNDLVVVVGGDLDTRVLDADTAPVLRGSGQYLAVFNMEDPAAPKVLASPVVSYRIGSAVTKVRWSPPSLVYEEFGADIQQLGIVNLQELLIGFGSTRAQQDVFPPGGKPGLDLNGDGDYVDIGDTLPLPDSATPEFYGKHDSYILQRSTQKILDFSISDDGNTIGVTLSRGQRLDSNGRLLGESLPPSYRTFLYRGQQLDLSTPTNAVFSFDGNAYPRWVTILNSLPILSNGVPSILPMVALVSLSPDADQTQKLAVVDISLPLQPKLLATVPFPAYLLGGSIQSVKLRSDRMLEMAGTGNILVLDPAFLLAPIPEGQLSPAIVSIVPAAGGITRNLGSTDYGVYSTADSGHNVIVQIAPTLQFVSFPNASSMIDPVVLHRKDEETLSELTKQMRFPAALPPANVVARSGVPSDLTPPKPALHYYVLMSAPGDAGETVELGLEAVNLAGRPLANPGDNFPPVRAISVATQVQLGQTPRSTCGTPIRSLTAYRLSDDPHSKNYNRYLSRPFALVCEKVAAEDLELLRTNENREVLFSAAALRAFIDPGQTNAVVGPFAARIDSAKKLLYPVSVAIAQTLDRSYLMGPNPPPVNGAPSMPGSLGMVSALNGEIRASASDMTLPSPRMPIHIERVIGAQDSYDGPFGLGWDFNYNQRVTELDPLSFPFGLQMPLVVRATQADSEIAGSQDVLLNSGLGRVIHFRWISTNMPPEYVQDPLVKDFDYARLVSDYYFPERGIFDLLVKFKDGRFERLTPDGMRYRYALDGRLETIMDRYPKNRHDLEYDRNGWLIRIDDRSVSSDRYVQFGHYRRAEDPDFNADIDESTDLPFVEGKICRLRDYAGGDVLFHYSDDGLLVLREGRKLGGENGGFSGRLQTHYFYNDCHFVGSSANSEGTPTFSGVSVPGRQGQPVTQSGTGSAGAATFDIPLDNSAAGVSTQTSSSTLADSSKTDYRFDKFSYLTSISISGGNGKSSKMELTNNADGLLTFIRHPEGETEEMLYDSGNAVFRSRGNLLSRTFRTGPRGGDGYEETYNYDSRYNEKSGPQKNANGFTINYVLTADKRQLAAIENGTAGTESYAYNDHGQVTRTLDIRGVETVSSWDAATGFLATRTTGPMEFTYSYGGDYASRMGEASTISQLEGEPTMMKYNGELEAVEISRGGYVQMFAFDGQGRNTMRRVEMGDGKAVVTRITYNDKGFITRKVIDSVEVDGQPSSIEYVYTPDDLSRTKSILFPDGSLQSFEYDNRGNVIKTTLGEYSEEFQADLNGNIVQVKQGGDVVRTITFDGHDRPVLITRRTGTKDETEAVGYFPGGELKTLQISDSTFGIGQDLEYSQIDEIGRPVSLRLLGNAISPSFTFRYSPGSVSIIGPRMTIQTNWDLAGNVLFSSNAVVAQTFHPDGNGRIERVDREEKGASYSEFYTFDDLDNLKSSADNLGSIVQYATRAEGAMQAATNALGHVTTYEFSVLDELLRERRNDGMEFRHEYDRMRRKSYVGDPSRGIRSGFDEAQRLVKRSLRNGSEKTFASFDSRNQATVINIPGGKLTADYDLQRRPLTSTAQYGGTIYSSKNTYDSMGRVRVVTYQQDGAPTATASFQFDPAGPLMISRFQEDGADFTIGFSYYSDGARKSLAYPSGLVVTEDRDAGGNLSGISDTNGVIFKVLSWQGNLQPKDIQVGSGISIQNQFDARGRLIASRAVRVSDGKVLTHMRYEFDAANNLKTKQYLHRGGRADVFTFDSGERLTGVRLDATPLSGRRFVSPLVERNYTYDSGGLDFLSSVSHNDLGGRVPPFASAWENHDDFLLPASVDGFNRGQADPVGNVAAAELWVRPRGAGEAAAMPVELTHNGLGFLVKVVRADGLVEENYYQPNGVRFERKLIRNGQIQEWNHYVYDPQKRLIEEYDRTGGTPALLARYFYGGGDAPMAGDIYNFNSRQWERYYYLRDIDQSVLAIATESGTVIERAHYDPFGQPVLEGQDLRAPVIRQIVAGDAGSLLIALSETVSAVRADPGAGVGIIQYPDNTIPGAVTVTANATNVSGTFELLPSLPGYPPFSVIEFTPAGGFPGSGGSLAAWWPGDARVLDVAGGHSGFLRGGAGVGPGLINQGFVLNGTSAYVEIPNDALLNPGTNDFTVAFWANFQSVSGAQVLMEKFDPPSGAGWSLQKLADNRVRLSLAESPGRGINIDSGPITFATNTWIQFAARRQNQNFSVFLNGTNIASGAFALNMTNGAALHFGGSASFFKGGMDEVRYFNRALNDSEVTSMAAGVLSPGPVTVSLNAGKLADEWGNANSADQRSILINNKPGTVYYVAATGTDTAAPPLARSAIDSPFLFHGQYFDYDTGLVYLRARFYDPFSGMFLEPDPLEYIDSVNLYAAMGNNPVSRRDPYGAAWWNSFVKFVRGAEASKAEIELGEQAAVRAIGSEVEAAQTLKRIEPAERVAKTWDPLLKDTSLVGVVKPVLTAEAAELEEVYVALAKSRWFAWNRFQYNLWASTGGRFFGVKRAASAERLVQALREETRFARVPHEQNAIFGPNHAFNETKAYWLQGSPGGFFSRRAARHELLHLAAAIEGQRENGFWGGLAHELIVQASSTPELIAMNKYTWLGGSAIVGMGYGLYKSPLSNYGPFTLYNHFFPPKMEGGYTEAQQREALEKAQARRNQLKAGASNQ